MRAPQKWVVVGTATVLGVGAAVGTSALSLNDRAEAATVGQSVSLASAPSAPSAAPSAAPSVAPVDASPESADSPTESPVDSAASAVSATTADSAASAD